MIRVLFAEDNAVVRKGIAGILQKQPDLEIVGEAENGVQALQLLQNGLQPDVLLTDLNMPEMNGVELIHNVANMDIDLPCIILTMHTDKAFMDKALAAGARGYLLKNGDMDELFTCIRNVHSGLLVIGKELQ
jgi:DNA-binding NarL/FixJ family response regulator